MESPVPGRRNVPALTGLRAIAAALVFFFHWFFSHADHLPLAVRGPFTIGYVGVPIFFALSGFLITLRYGRQFTARDQWGWPAFWRYYWRRVVRILPLYLFVLLFLVVAFGRPKNMMPEDGRQTIILLSLTQALFNDTVLLGTTVGWTLTLEMIYYALAPILVRFVGLTRSAPNTLFRMIFLIVLGFWLAYALSQVVTESVTAPLLAGQSFPRILHYSIFGQLGAFLFGQLAATAFLNGAWQWLGRHTQLLTLIAVGGSYGAMLWLATDLSVLGGFPNHVLVLLIAFLASLLIFALALAQETGQRTWVGIFLGSRPMVYLGLISYALYLVQLTEPVQWAYWVGLGVHGGIEDQVWRAIWLYVVVTLGAALLYEWCEKPLHRLLTRRHGSQ